MQDPRVLPQQKTPICGTVSWDTERATLALGALVKLPGARFALSSPVLQVVRR